MAIEISGSEFKNLIEGSFSSSHNKSGDSITPADLLQGQNWDPREQSLLLRSSAISVPNNEIRLHPFIDSNINSLKKNIHYNITSEVNLGINNKDANTVNGDNLNNSKYLVYEKNIYISLCSFERGFSVNKIYSKFSITFSNCIFLGDFNFNNSNINSASFHNCYFENVSLHISSTLIYFLYLEKSTFDKIYLSLYNFPIPNNSVHFIESHANFLNINGNGSYLKFKEFSCSDVTVYIFGSKLDLACSDYKKNDNKLIFTNLSLHIEESDKSNLLSISDIKIKSLNISGRITQTNVELSNLIILKEIKIQHLVNNGLFKLHNIEFLKETSLKLLDSRLGFTEFHSINFSQIKNIQIHLTNINNVTLHSTVFPNLIIGKTSSDLEGIREVYRQLKNAASKEGDRFQELQYEQFEMDAYEDVLRKNGIWKDRIILWSNKFSNNHGQDWVRPLILLFSLSPLLFIFAKMNLGYLLIEENVSLAGLSDFLNFSINPIHNFTDVFYGIYTYKPGLGAAKLIDFIERLISGYFIFQFLRAFRKYARQSES